jgi:hypothetical protein
MAPKQQRTGEAAGGKEGGGAAPAAAQLPLAALPDTSAQTLWGLLDVASRCRLRLVCKALKSVADRQLETVALDCTGRSALGPAGAARLLERHPLAARVRVLCTRQPPPPGATPEQLLAAAQAATSSVEAAAALDLAAALQAAAADGKAWPHVTGVEVGDLPRAAAPAVVAALCGGLLPNLASLRLAPDCAVPAEAVLAAAGGAAGTLRVLEAPALIFAERRARGGGGDSEGGGDGKPDGGGKDGGGDGSGGGAQRGGGSSVEGAAAALGRLTALERLAWGTENHRDAAPAAATLTLALPRLQALTRLMLQGHSERAAR